MTPDDLKTRTKQFALRNIKLFRSLPKAEEAKIIGRQMLRSSISVGANYRAACRARSNEEFFSKISIVLEEADETLFWHELLIESEIIKEEKLSSLMKEADELVAIMASTRKTIQPKTRHAKNPDKSPNRKS